MAIITNGQIVDQEEKAEVIGVRHLMDGIFTSERVGCCKADPRIFQRTIKASEFSSSMHVMMVGDSVDSDIKGALVARLSAILYSPPAQESQHVLFGKKVPPISHMSMFLEHLNITETKSEPFSLSRKVNQY